MPRTPSLHWMTTHVTTADGALLRAFVYEPAGADEYTPTVVMAHGWALDHRSWEPVARQLAADGGARLVAYDQRGHGESTLSHGRWRTGGETVHGLGNDLAQVINALVPPQSPLVLAGHSMGGMTVMAFAGLHPDVVRARVCAVVLVSTSAGDVRGLGVPGDALAARVLAHIPLKPGRLVLPVGQRRTSFGEHPNPADVDEVCRQIGNTRLSTTGTYYAALTAHDEKTALANLATVPVIVLSGTEDKLLPTKHSQRLVDAIPGAQLERIDGAGHMLMYEATDAVTSAVRRGLAQTSVIDDYRV